MESALDYRPILSHARASRLHLSPVDLRRGPGSFWLRMADFRNSWRYGLAGCRNFASCDYHSNALAVGPVCTVVVPHKTYRECMLTDSENRACQACSEEAGNAEERADIHSENVGNRDYFSFSFSSRQTHNAAIKAKGATVKKYCYSTLVWAARFTRDSV